MFLEDTKCCTDSKQNADKTNWLWFSFLFYFFLLRSLILIKLARFWQPPSTCCAITHPVQRGHMHPYKNLDAVFRTNCAMWGSLMIFIIWWDNITDLLSSANTLQGSLKVDSLSGGWLQRLCVWHSSSILIITFSTAVCPLLFCWRRMRLSLPDTAIWLCDIISPPPSQLMEYLLSPRPLNPVSSGRSNLQCKTISAHEKRQFLQSIDHKLLLENGIIFTKGYSLSSQGPEGNPSFFNNMYV